MLYSDWKISHWKHARLHLRCKSDMMEGAKEVKMERKSEIPFPLHIFQAIFSYFFLCVWRYGRIENKWSTYFNCLSLIIFFQSYCVLSRAFRFSSIQLTGQMKVISFKWIDTNVKYFTEICVCVCLSIDASHRILQHSHNNMFLADVVLFQSR